MKLIVLIALGLVDCRVYRPLPGTAPWYKPPEGPPKPKQEWVDYRWPDFGPDPEMEWTAKNIRDAEKMHGTPFMSLVEPPKKAPKP